MIKEYGIIEQWGKERSVIYFVTQYMDIVKMSPLYIVPNSVILNLEETDFQFFNKFAKR